VFAYVEHPQERREDHPQKNVDHHTEEQRYRQTEACRISDHDVDGIRDPRVENTSEQAKDEQGIEAVYRRTVVVEGSRESADVKPYNRYVYTIYKDDGLCFRRTDGDDRVVL
tara:strand:+ start:1575 stop:1910 length:336 start_codon:yes stop_codon:yes gene_type:complete